MFIVPLSSMTGSAAEENLIVMIDTPVYEAEPGQAIPFVANAQFNEDPTAGGERIDVTPLTLFTWDFWDGNIVYI